MYKCTRWVQSIFHNRNKVFMVYWVHVKMTPEQTWKDFHWTKWISWKKKISALVWNTSSMLNLLILSLPPSNLKKKNHWISMKVIGNKLNILKNVKKKIIHYLSCPSHRNYTPEKKQIIDEWMYPFMEILELIN